MDVAEQLARMNYFNGLRLEATDFRTEQRFHLEVRRRLTAALFSPGIATGLEVEKVEGKAHFIRVEPGVAIDRAGREMILLDPVEMAVVGVPNPIEGVTLGNYVAIEYGEERTTPAELAACWPEGAAPPLRSAPSRIVHMPRILFLDSWPSEESGRIVLGQIALGQDCRVLSISADVRRYVAAARPPATVPLSLEGEKDIDANNPKVLRFHVEGDTPQRAVLYLRASMFSSLYYSELGRHQHPLDLSTRPRALDLAHTHTADDAETDEAGEHTHNYRVDEGETSGGIDVNQQQQAGRVNTDPSAIIEAGTHVHPVTNLQLDEALADVPPHDHRIVGITDETGATGTAARVGARLTHIDGLRVFYDNIDITGAIIAALNDGTGPPWTSLGDGSNGHPLVTDGTGPIDLVRLGLDLSVDEHRFEFRIQNAGVGGQIQYNLYLS